MSASGSDYAEQLLPNNAMSKNIKAATTARLYSPTSLHDLHNPEGFDVALGPVTDQCTDQESMASADDANAPEDPVSDQQDPNGTGGKKATKRRKLQGFRKAPQAPKRFKSPYILFSISRMEEYKREKGTTQVTKISSHIAKEWKELSCAERRKWEHIAMQDKLRYNAEKSLYTGPWQVPSKRTRKVGACEFCVYVPNPTDAFFI